MQRLNSINPETAQGRTKEVLDNVQQALGSIPNAAKVMANSPAVLESYLAFSAAMGQAKIGDQLHHLLKLKTSESNDCDYCTSISCAVGPSLGLSAEDILAGRTGNSTDQRTNAALKFADEVLNNAGKVSDERLAAIRDAGFDDGEIVEIVASVILGSFTNFLNNVANTDLDIPQAAPVVTAADSNCSPGACSVA